MTLTLHPTIDRVLALESLVPGATFDARMMMTVPAGKGVNTARVLRCVCPAPCPIVAAAWIGAAERDWFARRLRELAQVRAALCRRPCFTRCASTLLEASGRETHIKEAMPRPGRPEEETLLAFWRKTVRRGDIVAFCGSAPEGTSRETLRRLFVLARRAHPRAIITDSNGPLLEAAGRAGLDGLKGNAAEIGAWLGLRGPLDVKRPAHRRRLMRALNRKGAPGALLITLGAAGALYAEPELLLRARPPAGGAARTGHDTSCRGTQHQSATGCGDAATAGWLWALRDGCPPEEILRRAVACGTAKLASPDPGSLQARHVWALLRATKAKQVLP